VKVCANETLDLMVFAMYTLNFAPSKVQQPSPVLCELAAGTLPPDWGNSGAFPSLRLLFLQESSQEVSRQPGAAVLLFQH